MFTIKEERLGKLNCMLSCIFFLSIHTIYKQGKGKGRTKPLKDWLSRLNYFLLFSHPSSLQLRKLGFVYVSFFLFLPYHLKVERIIVYV